MTESRSPRVGDILLQLRGASRRYGSGEEAIYALRGIDLDICAGEMIALVGASGSGKSTLMNILGCLDRLNEGSYRVAGRDTAELDADQLAALRRAHFGFVFQRYNLLPQLSAAGQCRGSGGLRQSRSDGTPQTRCGSVGAARTERPRHTSSTRTLWRTAAARLHRQGLDERRGGHFGRRTNRRARPRQWPRGDRALAGVEPSRPYDHHCDA